jgi:fermentation-respiration switch protein FrsA (DUF1100 family)
MTTTAKDSGERIVRANGVDLCVQTFGTPADPAILLISGAATNPARPATGDDSVAGDREIGPDLLRTIEVPALVIHGRKDPLFPIEHGFALEKALPHATLLPLDDTGHELPRAVWDVVVPALVRHTGVAEPPHA